MVFDTLIFFKLESETVFFIVILKHFLKSYLKHNSRSLKIINYCKVLISIGLYVSVI